MKPDAPGSGPSGVPQAGQGTALAQWLVRIEQMHTRPVDMGLERIEPVWQRLGIELNGVRFVVAGTNGKGSTCAMLEAICRAAGFHTGCYTSPHLLRFNERARLDGQPAEDAALVEQFEAVEAARAGVPLTYFEFTTLAILRLFAQAAPDVVILEIGLGGRLDAVNLVDADCAIITPIDLDHTELLGPTREAIGLEKAHIMRPGRPVVVSDPSPPQSVLEYAERIGAPLWRLGVEFTTRTVGQQQWSYTGPGQRRNSLAWPALRGINQLANAAGALAALEAVRDRLPIPQQAVRLGLAHAEVPGRFQVLPGRPTVVLDVAHNPHAAAQLARNLGAMGFHPYTWAVFGMLADKDVAGTVALLREVVDHWIVVSLPGARGSSAEDLAATLRAAGLDEGPERSVVCATTPTDGIRLARERAGADDRIVVFGSFLTVAGVLESAPSGGIAAERPEAPGPAPTSGLDGQSLVIQPAAGRSGSSLRSESSRRPS